MSSTDRKTAARTREGLRARPALPRAVRRAAPRTRALEGSAAESLCAAELSHRLKNILSLVQSLVNQSFRHAASAADAHAAITGRIAALARSQDILCRPDPAPADLMDLVADAAAVHAGAGARAFRLNGASLALRPEATLFFTLLLHELATNAFKHGALSRPDGVVRLDWSLERTTEGRALVLVWRERGGPAVAAPARRGFGTQLLERMVTAHFGGAAALDFASEGLTYRLSAPLAQIEAAA